MKTVIYHSADYDGIFCREIAKKFLGPGNADDPNQYIGWNFGDPPLDIPADNKIYILDLPLDKPFGSTFKDGWLVRDSDGEKLQPVDRIQWDNWVWIDHHKSSIESHPKDIPGYRIDGVAACRLAWQWFTIGETYPDSPIRQMMHPELPGKEKFVNREVFEPLAVRLAGEYDVWDHRGDGDLELQFGLRSIDLTDYRWSLLLNSGQAGDDFTRELLNIGQTSMDYARNVDAGNMKASFIIEWEGLKFLCLNGRGNSNTYDSRDVPETGHDALMMFYFNGRNWIFSLYHAKHRKDLDLSAIAVKYGGGGHRGACGFTCDKLPFTT